MLKWDIIECWSEIIYNSRTPVRERKRTRRKNEKKIYSKKRFLFAVHRSSFAVRWSSIVFLFRNFYARPIGFCRWIFSRSWICVCVVCCIVLLPTNNTFSIIWWCFIVDQQQTGLLLAAEMHRIIFHHRRSDTVNDKQIFAAAVDALEGFVWISTAHGHNQTETTETHKECVLLTTQCLLLQRIIVNYTINYGHVRTPVRPLRIRRGNDIKTIVEMTQTVPNAIRFAQFVSIIIKMKSTMCASQLHTSHQIWWSSKCGRCVDSSSLYLF